MRDIKLLSVFLLSLFSIQSYAALIELDTQGSVETMATSNDFFYGLAPSYDIGGNIYTTSLVDLTFTYLGHEAGYNNDFTAYDQTLNNKSNSIGESFTVSNISAGLMDFSFYSNSIHLGIDNGANNPFESYQSFATILDFTYNNFHYDAIVLFDDSGAGPDDNHDDHIIGINAVSVPEPAVIFLMGTGLIGLGLARRKIIK